MDDRWVFDVAFVPCRTKYPVRFGAFTGCGLPAGLAQVRGAMEKDCETESRPPDGRKKLLDTTPEILGEREIYGEKE